MMQASKMRLLNEARKEWESRKSSNSPFRLDAFQRSTGIFDGLDTSPRAHDRGYSLRIPPNKEKLSIYQQSGNSKPIIIKKKISSGNPSSNSLMCSGINTAQ